MRTIRVSEEVWQAIASRGKFGETEDDVLRRVFELPASAVSERRKMSNNKLYRSSSGRHERFADQRMSPYIEGNKLHVDFEDGNHSEWPLPERTDKAGISAVTQKATSWAESHGATLGQINYIRKVLTSNSYYITK